MLVKYFQHLHANFIKGISYGQYVGCIEIFKSKICFARKEDMSSHFYLTSGKYLHQLHRTSQWCLSHIRRPKHINLMHNDALNSSKVQGALSIQKEMSTGVSKKSKCSTQGNQLALLTLSRVLIGLYCFSAFHTSKAGFTRLLSDKFLM